MAERIFEELKDAQTQNQRQLSVGLDTNIDTLKTLHKEYPGLEDELAAFSKRLRTNADYMRAYNYLVIDATYLTAGAYKPNRAFYDQIGSNGYSVLKDTVTRTNDVAPWIMTTLDAKIQDTGETNLAYGKAYFDKLGFDAVTVHPYLSGEALKTLTDRKDKGFLVMGRTSNAGAGEFQDQQIAVPYSKFHDLLSGPVRQTENFKGIAAESLDGLSMHLELYKYVTLKVANHWNVNGNCGLVAGATYPEEAGFIRKMVGPNLFLLIPGVGEQGGKAHEIVPQALQKGEDGVVNASRSVIFAKRQEGETQWEAIKREALSLHNEIVMAQKVAV